MGGIGFRALGYWCFRDLEENVGGIRVVLGFWGLGSLGV